MKQFHWLSAPLRVFMLITAVSFFMAIGAHAQLQQSGSSSTAAATFTAGAPTATFSHTVNSVANRVLIVSVHLNTDSSTGTTVSSVSYGGTALLFGSAGSSAGGPADRVELWYMMSPPVGTATVSVTLQTFSGTVRAVLAASTFQDVDQGTNSGVISAPVAGNTTAPTSTVAANPGELVVDFLSVEQANPNITSSLGAGQTALYNANSGPVNSNTGVLAVSSSEPGPAVAGNVVMSYTDSGAKQQWVKLTTRLFPASTDVEITGYANPDLIDGTATTVTFTYTITAASAGANNVNFSNTLPAGLTIVSATPSQGTCTPATTTNCSIGTLLSADSTATVTIVATTANAGLATVYNTAGTITSGTTDVNSANNTATVTVRTQSHLCANPGKDGAGGTVTGSVNTYFPGTASAAAGVKTLTVGAATGTTPIAIGDLLLVIQMQDSAVDGNNDDRYGDGSGTGDTATAGSGSSSLNNSGRYEYVIATNAVTVAGGTVNFTAAGVGGGLIYAYTNAAATTTQGQRRYQVVRVPQYTTATLSPGTTAPAWNGTVGGVLAIDASGTITMGSSTGTGSVATTSGSQTVTGTGTSFLTQVHSGDSITITGEGTRTVLFVSSNTVLYLTANATTTGTGRTFTVPNVSLSGLGFRGGAGRGLGGGTGTNLDYRTTATDNVNGSKGEGIAGTPRYLFNGTSTPTDTTIDGYPNGSSGRGAPGNAGGGGTDGNIAANDQNSGGAGGGNAGNGGAGGNAWSSAIADGGFGGVFEAPSTTRIVLGGGGGAGSTNNSTASGPVALTNGGNSGGVAGGGLVLIRAGSISGTGTISANGSHALDVLNDAGGGGGAGGTILVTAQYGTLTGLTLTARGGNGGNAWLVQTAGVYPGERHGPGGGGGGGAVYLSSTAGSVDVSGGTNGLTTSALDNFGAGPGATGITTFPLAIIAGADSSFSCAIADLAVTNVITPVAVAAGGNIAITQTLTNNGPNTADQVVFTSPIPASATFQSIVVPPGFTCVTPAVGATGIIRCTASSLASGASVNFAVVVQAHAGTPVGYTISDTATATSNTNDSNYANNSATDTVGIIGSTTADIGVVITAPVHVVANTNYAYTQTVTNSGGAAAANASFTETIPTNTTFQSIVVPAGWTCVTPAVGATGTVTCTNPSLASGASASFPLTVKPNVGVAAGTVITETATVSTTTTDSNTTNNTSTATSTVVATNTADLGTTITALTSQVGSGDFVSFSENVVNNGVVAAGASFTQTVPANTTFVSMTVPTGWTCTLPAVGAAAGTSIPCTSTGTFAVGASSTFTPIFQVVTGTAASTTISQTVNIATTGGIVDSVSTNNSATASSVVRATGNADLGITKSDSPDPVGQGQLITYLLTVVNNGPEVATGVTASDTLPAGVSYVSASPSTGTCSGTTTVTCAIGTLAVNATATVSIVVQATTTGTISNTATVTGTKTDPVSANNSATTTTTVLTVTLVRLRSFSVAQTGSKAQISWQTSFEADNLGFNVYRDVSGVKTKINKNLIAGSALLTKKHDVLSGQVYRLDDRPDANTFPQYWLEDVDIAGRHTMHGPVSPSSGAISDASNAQPLAGIGANGNVVDSVEGYGAPRPATLGAITDKQMKQQADLAGDLGLKIYTKKEGWYRLTRAAMTTAGYDPGSDPRAMSLYTAGIEQPLVVDDGGDGKFDANDAIEFYAAPLDTVATGARTYWLRGGSKGSAFRVPVSKLKGADPVTGSVPFTYERFERSIFFAALTNTSADTDTFYGPIVTTDPVSQTLSVGNLDTSFSGTATLELNVQGGTDQIAHVVAVSINGHSLGNVSLNNQELKSAVLTFPHSWLISGPNSLTLRSLNGDDDVSVIASTRLTYQHLLTADNGALEAVFPGGRSVTVGGFTTKSIRALDVTDPQNPTELETTITPAGSGYSATFTTLSDAKGNGVGNGGLDTVDLDGTVTSDGHTVLVFQSSRLMTPGELAANTPSTLAATKSWSDLLIISNNAFASAAATLKPVRAAQGISSTIVDVDDIYDEFNFGIRSPDAIKSFLLTASKAKTAPKYVMLVGDASIDPRNYLELGAFDFMPTKIVTTSLLKTASDDWFTDFNGDGIADVPVGRIPVRTSAEATVVFGKLTSRGTPSGSWASSAMFVNDRPGDYDFGAVTSSLKSLLPGTMTSTSVDYAQTASPGSATISGFNSGALVVDYVGHASVEMWGENAFLSNDALALTNGSKLPFVVSMNCLNGYFHDLYTTSMAEALLKAPNGGAIAVWASSTLTQPDQQAIMNRELFRQLFTGTPTLGEAVMRAKAAATDSDVRKSWIFFGDPSMKLR
jgi:uncharacterized repeat protein (TIGR01451 family)